MRSFDLSQSPSESELALFEKPVRSTKACFRRLIPSTSSGTRIRKSYARRRRRRPSRRGVVS